MKRAGFISDNVTIEMWVNPAAIGGTIYAFDHSHEYSLSIDSSGAVRCTIGTGGNPVTSQTKLAAGTWSVSRARTRRPG